MVEVALLLLEELRLIWLHSVVIEQPVGVHICTAQWLGLVLK